MFYQSISEIQLYIYRTHWINAHTFISIRCGDGDYWPQEKKVHWREESAGGVGGGGGEGVVITVHYKQIYYIHYIC